MGEDRLVILQGDVLERLRELPDASIQCCITSPPYWGLRDYGTATWEGGDPACDHKQGRPGADGVVDDRAQRNRDGVGSMGGDCRKCGARRIDSQIGLEDTPDAYVARLVEVFREVRRVLRDDGVVFLNLGDSYFGGGGFCPDAPSSATSKSGKYEKAGALIKGHMSGGVRRAAACDTFGKAPEGSQSSGCLCGSLCDACLRAYRIGKAHSGALPAPTPAPSPCAPTPAHRESAPGHPPTLDCARPASHSECATPDRSRAAVHAGGLPLASQGSTPAEFDQLHQEGSRLSGTPSVCRLCGCSFERCAPASAGTTACTCGTGSHADASDQSMSGTPCGDLAYLNLTNTSRILKPKDLVGIPWRVAFALQADGWWLRQDIIWCLSGGAWLYARTQKGEMPVMVKDLVRLDPTTVQLWNGQRWTQVRGWTRSVDTGERVELRLRSGERVGCTGGHQWPTQRGLVAACDLRVGDVLSTCRLPDAGAPTPAYLIADACWLAGLFLAEGSWSEDTMQLSLNADEVGWIPRIEAVTQHYGATVTHSISGNNLAVRMYGRVLEAVINSIVGGRTARAVHLRAEVWRLPNAALLEIARGYLDGDGSDDGDRWRLGFTRNYALERDLRTLAARLGATLTLNPSVARYQNGTRPAFRGEWRWARSGHHNEKDRGEVVAIGRSRARQFWDIGVADDPHLFALASGVLTHNSKPNPMPESVTDRCTKAHEYVFLLSKAERYYYDAEAVKEAAVQAGRVRADKMGGNKGDEVHHSPGAVFTGAGTRNKRSVWTIATQPYPEAHFATWPEALVQPMVLAGCPEGGRVLDPFAGSGTTGAVALSLGRVATLVELNPAYVQLIERRCRVTLGLPGLG